MAVSLDNVYITTDADAGGGYSNGVKSGEISGWKKLSSITSPRTIKGYWDDGVGSPIVTHSRVNFEATHSWTATVKNNGTVVINGQTVFKFSRTKKNESQWSTDCNNCYRKRRIGIWTNNDKKRVGLYDQCIDKNYSQKSITVEKWTVTLKGKADASASNPTSNSNMRILNPVACSSEAGCSCNFTSTNIKSWKCSGTVGSVCMDKINVGIRFQNRNVAPAEPVNPPRGSVSCDTVSHHDSSGLIGSLSGSINYNCVDCSECDPPVICNNYCRAYVAEDVVPDESEYDWRSGTSGSTSPSWTTSTLNPNAQYFTRIWFTNGTEEGWTNTCCFVTVPTNSWSNFLWFNENYQRLTFYVNEGSGYSDVETKVYYSENGGGWQLYTTTEDTGNVVIHVTDGTFKLSKNYQFKIVSSNDPEPCHGGGDYTSTSGTYRTPAPDYIAGVVTQATADIEDTNITTSISYCYMVTTDDTTDDFYSFLQYRPLGTTGWATLDQVDHKAGSAPATVCGVIPKLPCNTTYELRTYQWIPNDPSTQRTRFIDSHSPIVTVTTPPCSAGTCLCDSLHYLSELICQEVNALKRGKTTVYANCSTRMLCDPYNLDPTWESILSRIIRYFGALNCIHCNGNMEGMFLKSGREDETYTAMAQGVVPGWRRTADLITEGDQVLAKAKAVYDAISDQLVGAVFSPLGVFDYYADTLADLDAETPQTGYTAVVGDKVYKYNGTTWVEEGDVPELRRWGMISVTKGANANHEFYWFNDQWNMLDYGGGGRIDDLAEDIAHAEETGMFVKNQTPAQLNDFAVVSNELTDDEINALIPTNPNRETVIYVYLTHEDEEADNPWIWTTSIWDGGDYWVGNDYTGGGSGSRSASRSASPFALTPPSATTGQWKWDTSDWDGGATWDGKIMDRPTITLSDRDGLHRTLHIKMEFDTDMDIEAGTIEVSRDRDFNVVAKTFTGDTSPMEVDVSYAKPGDTIYIRGMYTLTSSESGESGTVDTPWQVVKTVVPKPYWGLVTLPTNERYPIVDIRRKKTDGTLSPAYWVEGGEFGKNRIVRA